MPATEAAATRHYPRLAAQVFGVPLMCLPDKVDMIIAGLGERLLGAPVSVGGAEAYTTQFGEPGINGQYRVVDGVGIIDVHGVLAHHGGMDADSMPVLGYDWIARRLEAAVSDDAVKAIMLNLNSPGGAVAGAFDLTDQVREAARIKPVHAAVGDMAASAAYAIASAATSISITRTGMVGSIGVVLRHIDASERLKQDGLSVTNIFKGAHKVDGHPFAPLSAEVRADLQADVDKVYDMFVLTVADNRGMDIKEVRATEARMYSGEDAVSMGLADRVETPDQLIARLSGRSDNQQEAIMPNEETPPLAAETTPGELAARYDAGLTAGAIAERERIGAILNCEPAAMHHEAALAIALGSDMDAAAAEKLLVALSAGAAADSATLSPLAAAMHNAGTPAVGDGGGDPDPEANQAEGILKNYHAATGVAINH